MTAGSHLDIDQQQLGSFVDAVFRHASAGSFISLRSFFDHENKVFHALAVTLNGSGFEELKETAARLADVAANAPAAIVFAPPIASFSSEQHAREVDLAEAYTLSVECDEWPYAAYNHLTSILGRPTVVVESGGHWIDPTTGKVQPKADLHWRLTKPAKGEELRLLKEARQLAAGLVGADPTSSTAVHPMRWPGSWHRKQEPRLCKIGELNIDDEISLPVALAKLHAVAVQSDDPTDTGEGNDSPETAVLVQNIMRGGELHASTTALAARFLGQGMFPGAVVKLIREFMEASTAPRDARWQARYKDIPRAVTSAQNKFGTKQTGSAVPLDILGAPELTGWPELTPDCLPAPLYRYVMAEAERLNVDPAPLSAHILSACSASISDAWSIRPKRNDHWTQQPRLWTCVVKDVGARGTEMVRAAFWPLRDRDRELHVGWQSEHDQWKSRNSDPKQRGGGGPEDPEPSCPRLVTNDATIEAASEILRGGGDHAKLTILCDELVAFLGGFGRYTDAGSAVRAHWLEAYDGGPHQIDRIRRGNVYVPNWSVVICGNIQPRRLASMAKNLTDDGLFQRFLTVHANAPQLGIDDDKPLDPNIGADYRQLHQSLAALGAPETACWVDDEGLAVRKRFHRLIERLQSDPTFPIIIRETAPKWSGLLARISLIFHLVQLATGMTRDPYRVTGATVAMATTFLRRIALPNLFRLGFETMPDEGAPATHARWIAGHILAQGKESITARDIGRAYRPLRGRSRDASEAMSMLVDAGWATPTDARHDSVAWTINPVVHTCFAAAAAKERERRAQVHATIRSAVTDL